MESCTVLDLEHDFLQRRFLELPIQDGLFNVPFFASILTYEALIYFLNVIAAWNANSHVFLYI